MAAKPEVGVLEGVRVLELGSGTPIALAGLILADYGAEVIKVEPPGGDPLRKALAWPMWGRGKSSIVLDLNDEDDRARAGQLAAGADVLIHNFRPGVAERLGVGQETLRAANPALIYCEVAGFPRGTRRQGVKGYDSIIAAATGLDQLFSRLAGGKPIWNAIQTPSYGAGITAVQSVLAALWVRRTTGRGQLLQTSMVQGWFPFDMMEWMQYVFSLRFPEAFVARQATSVTQGVTFLTRIIAYTKDGRWLQCQCLTPTQFKAYRAVLGLETLWHELGGGDDEIDVPTDEGRHRFWEAILAVSYQKTYDEWSVIFADIPDIGFELMRAPHEALSHPQLVHNRQVITVEDRNHGATTQLAPIALLGEVPGRVRHGAPSLGEHQAILDAPRRAPAAHPGTDWPHAQPLTGITLVEVGNFFAGPYGPALLTDFGVRVIKIEPFEGDPMRHFLPTPELGGVKCMQSKESIALNLKHPEGQRILHQLVERSDVFMHNYRPGAAGRMGLAYDDLRKVNPRLVYHCAAGYGNDGPHANRPIYAITATTISGHPFLQAARSVPPPGTPLTAEEQKRYSALLTVANRGDGDPGAAIATATGIMLGLHARDRIEGSQFNLTSMPASNCYTNAHECIDYAGRPPVALQPADLRGPHALDHLYETAAGWVCLCAPQEKEWPILCRALEREGWLTDERFATKASRAANDGELTAVLATLFATRHAHEWEQILCAEDIACVELWTEMMQRLSFEDPEYRENGLVVPVTHPLFDEHLRYGPTVFMSETPLRSGPGCLNGQHTRSILCEIGYSDDEIAALEARGVVMC